MWKNPKRNSDRKCQHKLNHRIPEPTLQARTPQAASAITPVFDSYASGLKEILHLLTSGTIKTYLTKFKGLMVSVKAQTDPISRMMAFFEGLMNIFQD